MELTLDQRKAIALAKARKRAKEKAVLATQQTGPSKTMLSAVPGADSVNAFARGFGEGIPIVGPLVASAADAVGSQIASWITGRTPEEERALAAQRMQADREAHPVATTAGNISGAIVPLSQVGAAGGAAAKVLGVTGSLPQRIVAGGISGAGITGADALARGDSPEAALDKAKWGGIIGGAAPVAERLVSVVWRAVQGKPLSSAEAALARAIEDDGIPLAELQKRIDDLGPDAVLADLGPNLQRQAGALASMPGEAQKMVRDALAQRAAATNTRIIGDVDTILGPAPVPSQVKGDIRAAQKALSPHYEAAFQGARAVDTSDLALDLDSLAVTLRGDAQKAAQKVRSMLNVTGVPDALDPDPRTLFEVRQAIDGMFAGEANPKVTVVLTDIRKQVDDLLASAVPGIKRVDEQFAELARQGEAFDLGGTALDSGRTAMWPQELADAIAKASGGQKLRLSQGARAEIERLIGTTTNNLNALKTALKGEGSWNRDRLALLFGGDKADKLLRILERERTYAGTHGIVTANSETAARQAAQAELDAGSPQAMRDLRSLSLTGLLASGAQKLANAGVRMRQSGVNSEVARALMARKLSPETLGAVERALLKRRSSMLVPAGIASAITNYLGQ